MEKKYFFYDMATNDTNLPSMHRLVQSIRALLDDNALEEFYSQVFTGILYSGYRVKTNSCNVEYEISHLGKMWINEGPSTSVEIYKMFFEELLSTSNFNDKLIVFDGREFDIVLDEAEKKIIIKTNKDIKLTTEACFLPLANHARPDIRIGPMPCNNNHEYIFQIGVIFMMPLVCYARYEEFIGGNTFYDCGGISVYVENGEVRLVDDEGEGPLLGVYPVEPFWKLCMEYKAKVLDPKKPRKLEQIAWDGKEFGLYVEYRD